MQTEPTILRAAEIVRSEIEHLVITLSPWDFDARTLQGACGIASRVLHKALTRLGVQNDFVIGCYKDDWGTLNHCWVEVPRLNIIVDITATQFNVPEPVSIVRPGGLYMPRARNGAATRKLRKWEGQSHIWYTDALKSIEDTCVTIVQKMKLAA